MFEHPWLSSIFCDPEVPSHLSAYTQLARMLRIEAAYSRVLDNEAAALAMEAVQITPQDLMLGAASDGLPVRLGL